MSKLDVQNTLELFGPKNLQIETKKYPNKKPNHFQIELELFLGRALGLLREANHNKGAVHEN